MTLPPAVVPLLVLCGGMFLVLALLGLALLCERCVKRAPVDTARFAEAPPESPECGGGDAANRFDAIDCAICLEPLTAGDCRPLSDCGHAFHQHCVLRWLRSHPACPTCRTPVK